MILYSFRRCPWAMRARLALYYAGINCEVREVNLRNKPAALLELSPKGTVPVLLLDNGKVIDESYDIMLWAIQQHDPNNWGEVIDDPILHQPLQALLKAIRIFKYQENSPEWQQNKTICEQWLLNLNERLKSEGFLSGVQCRLIDAALFPLIRQVSRVDLDWFAALDVDATKQWLDYFYQSSWYELAMHKYPVWQPTTK